jgi:ABC-type dipeptide/oligopeptide/nickel transport system ATPase component
VRIKDFALVEEQRLEFGQGLCAITGESGSGKSVLVSFCVQGFSVPLARVFYRWLSTYSGNL